MSQRTAVLNVVGLTPRLLGLDTPTGPAMPRLRAAADKLGLVSIKPVLPAVTCTAQSTYVTGLAPSGHGCVANGWFDRDLSEHHFWKQSNHLVQGEKLWEKARKARPGFTSAKLFWWYNMYATVDWSVTPRPMYPADGRKIFDIYTNPSSMREDLKQAYGPFPFAAFWGPMAGIDSSEWIARSAEWTESRHKPDLSLVYLPHLDYDLQRFGPNDPRIAAQARAIDDVAGKLMDFYAAQGVRSIVLSEYGITEVKRTVALNRIFRAKGWIALREELGRDLLDCGASRVFAIADHQVAHIYLNDPSLLSEVRSLLEKTDGVASVLDGAGLAAAGLDHARSGDLVAFSAEDAWFTYYYWEDETRAPDFARCIDIFRKYGYDPLELFIDPKIPAAKLKILFKLAKKTLGFRMLMDVISLDPSLIRGSHGTLPADRSEWPVLIGAGSSTEPIPATAVHDRLLAACLGK